MKDYVIRAIDEKKNIRVFISMTTNMVNKARGIHETYPTTTAAIGRMITASSIMGAMLKNEQDKLTLQIKGDGPIGSMVSVSDYKGNVKALVANPNVELPPREDGKFDVGSAVGRNGSIIVIKDLGLKKPYIGKSPIISGEIAEDIANYFVVSEQQPSAVALGVHIGKDESVISSGGFIVQILPNIEEEELLKLEECINDMQPISSLIKQGLRPEDILERVFGVFNMEIVEKKEISFVCDCSKEKMAKALITVGKEEIEDMIKEDGKAELTCHFCKKSYNFSDKELKALIQ
ncbi:Hsp33 family molecular chaperone HslO [Clostridiaceae bacterium M8S5]|nr:Hsp33 family molecular chaperone HslO [Clostridiaceae bacterium M8S5]